MTAAPTEIGFSSGREDSHAPSFEARLQRALGAAHQLCDVLWEELREHPAPMHARELAERIADLASTVALLAGAARETTSTRTPVALRAESAPVAPVPPRRAPPEAKLIDEYDAPAGAWWRSSERRSDDGVDGDADGRRQPAWLDMLDGAVSDFERDRAPFAVLLIEVLGAGEHFDPSEQLRRAAALALDGLGRGSLAPESPDRYWLLVPRADRPAARTVSERLAHAVADLDHHADRADAADRYFAALSARGSRAHGDDTPVALRIAVGTAACPDDGREVRALIAQAHVELAQARSLGWSCTTETEPAHR